MMYRLTPSACRVVLVAFSLISCAFLSAAVQAQQAQSPQAEQPARQPSYADLEKPPPKLLTPVNSQEAERPAALSTASAPLSTAQPEQPPAAEAAAAPTEAAGKSMEFQSQGGSKLVAGWDEGFFMRSSDNNFHLRVTGQIQADYRAYMDGLDFTDIDRFFLRRARFGIEADMFKYYEFRLLPDYGQGQSKIQDAYLNVHYWDAFQVEAGKFKQPVSYEQLIQDRYVPTLERSLFDQLVPARDEGVMLHGRKLFDDKVDWAVSVSNGEINGDTDTNKHKDLNGRIAARPLNDQMFLPGFRLLQIGISGSTGKEQEPMNPASLSTPAGVRFFQFNPSVRANGLRNRWSPEVSYFYRSFGFAAQYYEQRQEIQPSFTGPTSTFVSKVPFRGWYFLGTYLLTGEERTSYSEAITPIHNFDPCHPLACSGAWEAVARVSRLRVGDDVFAPGPARLADPTLYSRGATETTLGFNWYLNKWVRTQFNWEHAWFDNPVRLGPGPAGLLKHQDSLEARFQIIF